MNKLLLTDLNYFTSDIKIKLNRYFNQKLKQSKFDLSKVEYPEF